MATVIVKPLFWEETLVAHYSKDERLKIVLEEDFGARVGLSCICCEVKEINAGEYIAHAGCLGLGKGWLSKKIRVSPIKSQQILNNFNLVFNKTANWVKTFGSTETQRFINNTIGNIKERLLFRCLYNLPNEWKHINSMTFEVPDYTDNLQIVKFFKHYFNNELFIEDNLVKLEVEVYVNSLLCKIQ